MSEAPSCSKCGEPSPYDEPCRACQGLPLFDAAGFGERLKARLETLRLSYRQAEPLIGVDHNTLQRVATATKPPYVENYLRISRWMSRTYEAALASQPA